ncbi:C40 family peptidase [Maribacter sp.]|uniref:C40 family peptidase n=1 Tax=Maribacter sp. TaxID=1897614 RepID=UPI0025C0F7AE|nr:C40 family peptidase [Maribacter sp.]
MFRKIILIFFLLVLGSCGVSKKRTVKSKAYKVTVAGTPKDTVVVSEIPIIKIPEKELSKADDIINTALTFSGVRYKYGGTTKKGMDCSGLLYVSFGAHDVPLPRVSYAMANEGKRIRLRQVAKGDLLFFKTSRRGKRINHVGMVVAVENDEIKFIHASSSRGVIVSSLQEGYWNYAFIKATRVL